MKFNKEDTQLFMKYFKYIIILRNVLSNYHKTNIKNIKLESIKTDINQYMIQNIINKIIIKFLINDCLLITINLTSNEPIYAFYISNFPKNYYNFNYDLIIYNNKHFFKYIVNKCKNKYFDKQYNNNIINKTIILKPLVNNFFLDTIIMNYYYSLYNYKIYIIYTKENDNIYNDQNDYYTYLFFNEYSYISKIFI